MGSADKDKNADANEKKQHKVKITAFSLGKYEVTKAEYAAFMQDASYEVKGGCYIWADAKWQLKPEFNWHNPGFTQADNEPVTCVSYEDAKAYIQWLNTKTEKTYRLPSEAEWEYAARAKTTGDYYWGSADSKDYAWYGDNAELKTHPVGKKKPNDYGLYDMSGNVWEWVQDNWRENYQRTPDDGSAWETAEADAPRVVRGGSWGDKLLNLSSAQRGRTNPDICGSYLGFRLAQD